MTGADDLLERNLTLLFARAWRPARPDPGFRARLGREFSARAERFARPRLRAASIGLAAAAALLAVGWAWRSLADAPELSRDDVHRILARGDVAWRTEGDAWHAAVPAAGVADLGPRAAPLEVRTPAAAQARLAWCGGELALAPAGALLLAHAVAGESSWLASGALEALAQGGALGLAAPDGGLALESGRARLAQSAQGLEVTLDTGRGRLSDVPAERDVAAPGRWLLRGGRVIEPADEPERRAAPRTAAAPEPDMAAHAPTNDVVLRGSVRAPDGFDEDGSPRWRAVPEYRLFLLRAVPLPEPAMPEERARIEGEGRFSVPSLEPGDYTIFVLAPGHAVWRSQELELGAAPADVSRVPELDVRLEAGLSVRGTLRDASGAPLAGALVLSERDAPMGVLPFDRAALAEFDYVRLAVSQADGSYALEHVALGAQVLRASGGGASAAWIDDLEVAGVLPLTGVDFELPPAGAIEGRVLDADGAPRAGAVVLASVADFSRQRPVLSYAAAVVDGEGRYAIEGLPSGMFAVLLYASGRAAADSAPDMRLVAARSGLRRTVDFLARREGARLAGRLLDSAGAPLPGRAIWIEADARGGRPASLLSATTDGEGRFAFEDLNAGPLDVYVAGLRPTELALVERLALAAGEELVRDFRAGSERVAGTVLAQADGAPVGGALVVLLEGRERRFAGKSMSDAAGAFEVPYVRPGLYELYVQPARGPVGDVELAGLAVAAGLGVEGLELRLPRGGDLALALRDDAGAPVAGAELRVFSSSGDERWCEEALLSDAQGELAVGGLSLGRWRVRAQAPGFAAAELELDVRAGPQAPATLVLARIP